MKRPKAKCSRVVRKSLRGLGAVAAFEFSEGDSPWITYQKDRNLTFISCFRVVRLRVTNPRSVLNYVTEVEDVPQQFNEQHRVRC